MLNTKELPIKDILISAVIIFTISTLIANIYNPVWGVFYAFGNIFILTFLGWLYRDSWDLNKKSN
tara:strand:- start:2965 stop:3159 length:195 start_codon:yes stop_codon:yes gene_type:complete